MDNNQRLTLFQLALGGVAHLEKTYPGYPPLVSIRNQIAFLIHLISGSPVNPADLIQVNLGLLTAREVETRDEKLAELLYKVDEEVDHLKQEYGLPVT